MKYRKTPESTSSPTKKRRKCAFRAKFVHRLSKRLAFLSRDISEPGEGLGEGYPLCLLVKFLYRRPRFHCYCPYCCCCCCPSGGGWTFPSCESALHSSVAKRDAIRCFQASGQETSLTGMKRRKWKWKRKRKLIPTSFFKENHR